MIYDCFPFFNELDILEIRLEELHPVIDKFIICESTVTHSNKPKELNFINNKNRYSKYLDKIEYLICDSMPNGSDNWKRENYQRRYLSNGIKFRDNNTLVMLSDCDEIPKRDAIEEIKRFYDKMPYYGPFTLELQCYYGKLTNAVISPEHHRRFKGTVVIPEMCQINDLQVYRNEKDLYPRRYYGGWHFSYIGDENKIIEKLESFAHAEFNNDAVKNMAKKRLENTEDLLGRSEFYIVKTPIDDSYPIAVINNPERYKHIL